MRNATWVLVGALVVGATIIASLLINTPTSPLGPPLENEVSLDLVADGLTHPLGVAVAPGIRDRSFVVDQVGTVHTLMANGTLLPEPFLDLRDEIVPLNPNYDERGLLSITFHPDFDTNHKVYAFYSAPLRSTAPGDYDHTNLIVELTVSDDLSFVETSTSRVILSIDNPYANHNGGQVLFGPDGYLYITVGDGGGSNDQGRGHNASVGNAQDLNSIHGKILRIDVDHGSGENNYSIPDDNPIAPGEGLPEIFAWGFRNPAYAAFDNRGRLFVADAGQARYEEVDLVTKGGNYGWRFKEGTHCFDPNDSLANPSSCPSEGTLGEPLIDPIGEFTNSDLPGGEGAVVIGGAPYDGNITILKGGYVFGAFRAGGSPLFALLPSSDGNWTRHQLILMDKPDGLVPGFLLDVGIDADGEILVLSADTAGPSGTTGKVWRVNPTSF